MPFKTEIGQQFPAEAFAYIGDPANPDTWALRIWESVKQKATAAQVSRAVASLSATRGGRGIEIPEDKLPWAKQKLTALWDSVHHELPVPTILKSFAAAVDVATFTTSTGLPPLVKTDTGEFAVLGMPILKTGTFRDSSGRQHTFDTAYLENAVQNFYALKDSGVLPNVPMRKDHARSVDSVVGYFENVYVDPTGEFLKCDFAFTDDAAANDYAKKKFRSRSIEIGPHTTNAEETYDPVIMGCAFVDLPAVEGLYSHPSAGSTVFPFEEIEQMASFTIKGVPTTDEKRVQEYIAELEAAKPQVHEFTLGTTKLTDPAAVQTQLDRIPAFETFMGETRAAGRIAAVDAAVAANKLSAPQAAGVKAFVATLTDDQFAAWKTTTDAAPAIPAFGTHMGGGNGDSRNPAEQNGAPDAIADAQEMVKMQKLGNVPVERIKESASYKRLMAANITVDLL